MGGRNLHADTRLAFRHDGIIEARDIDAFFLQLGREDLAEFGVIQHDGADSRLRRFDIEACGFHAFDEVGRVLVQAVLQLVAAREDLEGLDTGRSNHRRDRVREEVRTAALTQEVDDFFLTRRKSAHRTAEGFAERAGDDLDLSAQVITLGDTVTGLTHYAGGVRLINHDERVVFLRQFVDLIERTNIAVHREHTVGRNDTETLCLCLLELCLEIRHVAIRITIAHRLTETHAIDDRRMVEGIRDDRILLRQQRFKQTTVRIKASGV